MVNGLNLYAYCGNNPVMGVDPNGNAWWNPFSWDWSAIGRVVGGAALAVAGAAIAVSSLLTIGNIPGSGIITQAGVSMAAYGGIMVASVFDSQIQKNMDDINWNPFNADGDMVVTSTKVSFYKGVPVFKHSIKDVTSGSFWGVIAFKKGDGNKTLNHEWGHAVQFWLLGAQKYLGIALPSLTANLLSRDVSNPIGSFLDDNYYSLPWERTAEFFGGLKNGDRAKNYLKYSLGISLIYLGLLI